MQSVTSTLELKDETVNIWQNIHLPCPVSTKGCAFFYASEEPKNCLVTVSKRFSAKMIRNEKSYYTIKGISSPSIHSSHTRDSQNFMLQVMNKPQALCGHPRILYPTSYNSFFNAYSAKISMWILESKLNQPQKRELFIMPANQILFFSQQVMICHRLIS